ncbi:MAG: flagellar motor switch protein FliN [Rhodoferax sp.]|nr:flagellar motor switch protein FliN [Rhodoferax sp.]
MPSEDKPDEGQAPADEGMADWAEALLEQKSAEDTAEDALGGPLSGDTPKPFTHVGETHVNDINMVLDIPVQLSVELGRTKVPIKHILQLGQGSVVELDALAGEPMDVLVNGYLIAQGEVVVVNDKFGIRLTDVVTPSERLKRVSRN